MIEVKNKTILEEVRQDIEGLIGDAGALRVMAGYHFGFYDASGAKSDKYAGKMFRPDLFLSFVAAFGGDPQKAIPIASGLQIFHDFSLVHDDIEDKDKKRRGRPTVWSIWGISQGINVGDYLFNLSFKALSRHEKSSLVISECTEIFEYVCQGQAMDIDFSEQEISEIKKEDYMEMITGKSAKLIEGACGLAALVTERDEKVIQKAKKFGLSLGLAYQLFDDYMGIWGMTEKTGKDTGSDIYEKKKAYPIIELYEKANDEDKKEIASIYNGKITDDSYEFIMKMHEKYGTREAVKKAISDHKEEAQKALGAIEISIEWQKYFRNLLDNLMRF